MYVEVCAKDCLCIIVYDDRLTHPCCISIFIFILLLLLLLANKFLSSAYILRDTQEHVLQPFPQLPLTFYDTPPSTVQRRSHMSSLAHT